MKNLALMQLDVQSRMYTYESNKSSAIKFVRTITPHIKSYTRLLSTSSPGGTGESFQSTESSSETASHSSGILGSENNEENSSQVKEIDRNHPVLKNIPEAEDAVCLCQPIAWSLITSSCLSRGTIVQSHIRSETSDLDLD